MRILNFRIENYKSFRDSQDVSLAPGFNVVVGKNDAGKTALVEALTLNGGHGIKPHRSPETMPNSVTPLSTISTTTFNFGLTAEAFSTLLAPSQSIFVPRRVDEVHESCAQRFIEATRHDAIFTLRWGQGHLISASLNGFDDETPTGLHGSLVNRGYPSACDLAPGPAVIGRASVEYYSNHFFQKIRQRVYSFRAERLNLGSYAISGGSSLTPNAENLADVLNRLSSANPRRYERFMRHVTTVFPHITLVSAAAVPGTNRAEIKIWSSPLEQEMEHLAVPLSESGTGIGQVLAMLYVVVTTDSPSIIIIDEPQSFLHPGAVRKLMEILRGYPQHQYIITTHAPLAIGTPDTDGLLLVRREGYESRIDPIDPANQADMRTFLDEVGARLSDVFGCDSILWVEGKTEEVCFPEIIRRVAGIPLQGVQVLGVVSTDELTAKRTGRVFDIYDKLTAGPSLMPPAVAFIFDRERRSEAERDDIDRRSKNAVRWLPRRMFENYLLDPSALAMVINAEDADRDQPVDTQGVEEWLQRSAAEPKFLPGNAVPYADNAWYERVDGAGLLGALFGTLTDARVPYDKVRHGGMLTAHLADQPSQSFKELAEWLKSVMTTAK